MATSVEDFLLQIEQRSHPVFSQAGSVGQLNGVPVSAEYREEVGGCAQKWQGDVVARGGVCQRKFSARGDKSPPDPTHTTILRHQTVVLACPDGAAQPGNTPSSLKLQ